MINDETKIKPSLGEVEEAKLNPNGWVYRIYGFYDVNVPVPPEAIVGAWRVDKQGNIVGNFIENPKFRSGK